MCVTCVSNRIELESNDRLLTVSKIVLFSNRIQITL